MSASDGEFGGDRSGGREAEPIDVTMSIRPTNECACAPPSSTEASIRQSLCLGDDGEPACQQIISSTSESEYKTHEPCENCPCFVFSTYDCVATLDGSQDGRLLYSVTLADRTRLSTLVEELREADASVSVDSILAIGEESDSPPVLTEKQREALSFALETGYYDQPRGATLDDLATELEISSSAVSQRLNAVNRRLIKKYCQQFEPDHLG